MVTQNSWGSQDPAQVAKGGTGLAATTAYAVLCGGTTTTGPLQSIAGVGTAAQVLTSNGAGALPTFQDAPASSVLVQQVRNQSATYTSTTATIPYDDTIPQSSEGTELMTLAITPTSDTNILVFDFSTMFSIGTGSQATTFCLFQDSNTNATYAKGQITVPTVITFASFLFYMVAGTSSSTTFKIRYGSSSGTTGINGSPAARIYGGVANVTFTISEIQV